jgi:transcriptional regulator with XRE-family HTH domain
VADDPSPTVLQLELGKRLRDLREQHGRTIEDIAAELLCSTTKVSRLETGARRPNPRDVRDLCRLYEVDEVTTEKLMGLARDAREPVWWTQYEDLNLDPYLGLEHDAVAITSYTTYYLPALLQTEEYTRAIIKVIAPKMNPDVFKQRVEVRIRRQEVLEGDSRPRYRVLLDEAVLHHQVGDRTVMAGQLDKVLEAERQGIATIQVVPFDAGAYAAQESNFVLLEFAEGSTISPVVFIEGLAGNQYIQRPADIKRYREAIEYLRDAALAPRDSINFIREKRDELGLKAIKTLYRSYAEVGAADERGTSSIGRVLLLY